MSSRTQINQKKWRNQDSNSSPSNDSSAQVGTPSTTDKPGEESRARYKETSFSSKNSIYRHRARVIRKDVLRAEQAFRDTLKRYKERQAMEENLESAEEDLCKATSVLELGYDTLPSPSESRYPPQLFEQQELEAAKYILRVCRADLNNEKMVIKCKRYLEALKSGENLQSTARGVKHSRSDRELHRK